MKHFYILLSLFICAFSFSHYQVAAQSLDGTLPPTYGSELIFSQIPQVQISQPDQEFMEQALARDPKNDMYVISQLRDADISTENAGAWEVLENGTSVWRCKITGNGAKALALHFNRFNLPKGSKLYVYDEERTQLLGGYNQNDNTGDKGFAIGLILGQSIIVEYVAPLMMTPGEKKAILSEEVVAPDFHISQVSYIFRGVSDLEQLRDFGDCGSCEVNVNCPEGNDWQRQKRAVVRIYVVEGNSAGWCSGTLINNLASDGTPYILTANHCGPNASAANFNQWMFFFNYEHPSCTNSNSEPSSNVRTGCTKKAYGSINGGSDFFLLQLNSAPDNSWNPIYAGWRRDNTAATHATGIHHPAGDVKKISSSSTITTGSYSGCASSAHWKISDWEQTQTNLGVTEGGSSGSGLFDQDGYLVGTLTGGQATCSYPHNDYYGKMYYHWDQNGSGNDQRLKPWLDPNNSGANTCPMYDPNNPDNPDDPDDPENPDDTTTVNPDDPYNPPIPGNCHKLHYPLNGTMTLYRMADNSFLSGTNSYGDLAKADYFQKDSTAEYITNFKMNIAHISGNGSVTFCVWADNNGQPGDLLGSKTVTLSQIAANCYAENDPQMPTNYSEFRTRYICHFDNSIPISGSFFAGMILPTNGSIALITNSVGDGTNTAWEKQSNSTWVPYSDSTSWGISLTHALFPELCDNAETNGIENNVLSNDDVIVYPNPTNGNIIVKFTNSELHSADIQIFDLNGKCLISKNYSPSSEVILNLENLNSSLYLIKINTGNQVITKKISIIK